MNLSPLKSYWWAEDRVVLPTLCQRNSKHFRVCTLEFFLEVEETVEVSAWSITEKPTGSQMLRRSYVDAKEEI